MMIVVADHTVVETVVLTETNLHAVVKGSLTIVRKEAGPVREIPHHMTGLVKRLVEAPS